MVEGAIDQMISTLAEDKTLLKDLTTPYAACVDRTDHDIPEMIAKLTKIAKDLLETGPAKPTPNTDTRGGKRNPAFKR